MRLPPSERTGPENTHAFVAELLGEDVHMTRVMSLANGVVGVLHAAALGIHAIGRGLADALDLDSKHAVKQVDRLLSNTGIKIWDWFAQWVTFVRDEEQPVATGCSPPHEFVVVSDKQPHSATLTLTGKKSEMRKHRQTFVASRNVSDASGVIEVSYSDGRVVSCRIGYITNGEQEPHHFSIVGGRCYGG